MNEAELEDRVNRVEDALWGPWRNNGLVRDVKAIRELVEAQDRKTAKREDDQRKERKADRKWWIGTVLVVILALLGAAQIVASSLT